MRNRIEDAGAERNPPSADEIERAMRVFEDREHIYYEAAAANVRDALAEDRRALGLRGVPRR